MEPFSRVASIITPLEKVNVDTDQIVPKQFLKLIQRTGFGRYLFYNWRYGQDGKEADFVLNDPAYRDSKILVTGENFGCGSSREHAVWALMDYGFSVVIAPSFADIFLSNCFKNGVLPVQLDREAIRNLYTETGTVDVDLKRQVITTPSGEIYFEMEPHRKQILLEGLDEITRTFQLEDEISRFERASTVPSVL